MHTRILLQNDFLVSYKFKWTVAAIWMEDADFILFFYYVACTYVVEKENYVRQTPTPIGSSFSDHQPTVWLWNNRRKKNLTVERLLLVSLLISHNKIISFFQAHTIFTYHHRHHPPTLPYHKTEKKSTSHHKRLEGMSNKILYHLKIYFWPLSNMRLVDVLYKNPSTETISYPNGKVPHKLKYKNCLN